MPTIILELPNDLYEKLRSIALMRDKLVEEFLQDLIIEKLNLHSNSLVNLYLMQCERFLKEVEKFLNEGNYVQASEKAWDAAVQIVKAIATKKEKILVSHRQLHEFVSELVKELKDNEIANLWSSANELHRNFYEN